MALTAQELRALGLAAYGMEWQSPLARAIGVNPRTVRKWAAGEAPISASAEADIRRALGAEDMLDLDRIWPRDAWIVGDGAADEDGRRREYLIHARRPRFIARVVAEDAEEGNTDTLTGVVYRGDGYELAEIVWIDPPPGPADLLKLMEAACDAVDAA